MSWIHWLIVLALVGGVALGIWFIGRASRTRAGGSTSPPNRAYQYRDSQPLSKWVIGWLCVDIALSAISILSNLAEHGVLRRIADGSFATEGELMAAALANDSRQQAIGLLRAVAMVAVGFFILKWIYRLNSNTHALGAKGLEYTPGWAVGWFFVPIFWLWKPYQAFREIWRASARRAGVPQTPPILLTWWLLWLGVNMLGQVFTRMTLSEQESIDFLIATNVVGTIYDAGSIVLSAVFLLIVRHLTTMQDTWRQNALNDPQDIEPDLAPTAP